MQIRLEQEGYSVIVAADGQEVMEQVTADPPDLILMDVMMPHVDGFEALRQLKDNPATSHIPVIMLTALDPAHYAARGEALGCDFYWTKPYVLSDPVALIQRVVALYKDA